MNTTNFGNRKWPGEVLRLAMLMTHYREPIDFSVRRLEEAEATRKQWLGPEQVRGLPEKGSPLKQVLDALADDLDFNAAKIEIEKTVSRIRQGTYDMETGVRIADAAKLQLRHDLSATLEYLGLVTAEDLKLAHAEAEGRGKSVAAALVGLKAGDIDEKVSQRLAFLAAKDFAEADRIRNELLEQGIQLKDGKDPVTGERVTTWEVKR